MNFRDGVPDKVGVALYACYLAVFQFANGFYFSTMAQLEGERALTASDTHMMGFTTLIGCCFFFPWAFRLKFRFTNKTSLTVAAAVLLGINLLFPHVRSHALLLLLCYVGGFFRLYGTFECLSNLLPRVTPTFNYAVFLSFVFFTVIGCVGIFDWAAVQIIHHYGWQHVHATATLLCILLIVAVQLSMRHFRPMPAKPLSGTDPLGMLLWSVFILAAIFAFCYGEELDWLHDRRIRLAIGISLLSLAASLWRMTYVRHAFIDYAAFRCPNLLCLLLLFLGLDVLLGAQTVLQNTFASHILGYGQTTMAWLKFPEWIGAAAAAVFCLVGRTRLHWRLRTLAFWSLFAVVAYEWLMCRLIWQDLSLAQLWLPSFLVGFGHVGVFIALTVYAQAYCDFKYYFQVLCILGFIRMGLGDAVGVAVWGHALSGTMSQHLSAVGMMSDWSGNIGFDRMVTAVANEALIESLRELYGWATVTGVGVLIVANVVAHVGAWKKKVCRT